MRYLSILVPLVALAVPAHAQLTVTVKATNDAGVTLVRGDNTQTTKNLPANTNFTKFTKAHIFEQTPVYVSQMNFVYPPFNLGPLKSNRVQIATSAQTIKKSGHKSLHTTDTTGGALGTQKYRISATTTQSTLVKLDWTFYAAVYDASVVNLKFTTFGASKSWTLKVPGSKLEQGSLFLSINGTKTIDVEINGACTPGTGNGSSGYDGFSGQIQFNFLEVGDGSFKPFGIGCAKGKIGSNGVPVRGSVFEVELNGDDPNKPCALLIGTSKDMWGNIKLPLDLTFMGAKGCWLNVSYHLPWYTSTDAAGNASLRTYMSAFLPKGTFYVQWMLWERARPNGPPTLTQGAEIKF